MPAASRASAPSEETMEDVVQGVRDDIVDKKGPKSSVVWSYFGSLKSDTEQISVHCKLCRAHVPTKTGNTFNLFHHLKQRHPFEHGECKLLQTQPGTSTILSPNNKACAAATEDHRVCFIQRRMTKNLRDTVILQMQYLLCCKRHATNKQVENKGFK